MEIEIEMEIEKEKGKSSPPSAGPNPTQPPLSRAPALPLAAQAAHLRSHTHAPPSAAASPAPPVSRARPRSLATALSLASGPACQPLPRARDQAIDAITAGRRTLHRFAINTLASSVWRLAPPHTVPELSLHLACPSHPVVTTVRYHRRRGKLTGARHLAPLPRPGRL
jgi:hypothetical protein